MFNYKSLLFLFLLLYPLLAKKATPLEGVWLKPTMGFEDAEEEVIVFTKDTIISYIEGEEMQRIPYTISGDTLIMEDTQVTFKMGKTGVKLIPDGYPPRILNRFTLKDLSKESQKLIQKITGEWYVCGTLVNGTVHSLDTAGERIHMSIGIKTIDLFVDSIRQNSNTYSVKNGKLTIEGDAVSVHTSGDTLILTTEGDEGPLLLRPLNLAPPIKTEAKAKELCERGYKFLHQLFQKAIEYEAMNGEFPRSLSHLLKDAELKTPQNGWTYSYDVEGEDMSIRATLKDQRAIDKLKENDFIEMSINKDIHCSNPLLLKHYLHIK